MIAPIIWIFAFPNYVLNILIWIFEVSSYFYFSHRCLISAFFESFKKVLIEIKNELFVTCLDIYQRKDTGNFYHKNQSTKHHTSINLHLNAWQKFQACMTRKRENDCCFFNTKFCLYSNKMTNAIAIQRFFFSFFGSFHLVLQTYSELLEKNIYKNFKMQFFFNIKANSL